MEQMLIDIADYPVSNFGIWHHHAISYKHEGNTLSDIFDLYLDGILLNGLERSITSGSDPDANTGIIGLARDDTSDPNGDDSNMKLDEIVFWERLLACDDIMRLYKG